VGAILWVTVGGRLGNMEREGKEEGAEEGGLEGAADGVSIRNNRK